MYKQKLLPFFAMTLLSFGVHGQDQIDFSVDDRVNAGSQVDESSYMPQRSSDNYNPNRMDGNSQQRALQSNDAIVTTFRDTEASLQEASDAMKSAQDTLKNVQGGFPNVDGAGIAAAVLNTIIQITNQKAKEEINDLKIEMKKEIAKLEVDNLNNAAAKFIQENQIQNIEDVNRKIEEQRAASSILCDQVASTDASRNTSCLSQDVAKSFMNTRSYAAFVQDNEVVRNVEAARLLNDIEQTHPSLFGVDDPEQDSVNASEVYAINGDALIGNATAYKSLSKEGHEAMKDFISLIVPDPSMDSISSNLSRYGDAEMTSLLSKQARKSFSQQSLLLILGLKSSESALTDGQSANPTSRMLELHNAIKSGVSESAIYKLSVGETSTPTRLYRTRLLSMVRALDLQLEQFKSQLRIEGQVAVRLASLIN